MEEEDGGASTPFWIQSRRNNDNTYFRRTSSLGGRATTVATQVFFAGAAAILIVFFIIPPFISSLSEIFRPHLVRKSWDYLNFVLVLFAVICGFLSRNTGNDDINHSNKEDINKTNEVTTGYSYNKFPSSPSIIDRGRVSSGTTPRYWIDDRGGGDQYPAQTVYKRFSRLRSNSYPDLSLREFEADERWRFYDDTRVSECRYEASDPIDEGYRNWQEIKPQEADVDRTEGGNGGGKVHSGGSGTEKAEVVTTEVVEELTEHSNPPPQSLYPPSAPPFPPSPQSAPPRAPSPPKRAKRKTKRVYQDVAPKEEKKERADFVAATPPLTPIPPPTTVYQKREKKKGGATKDFLTALRRKKKKQRQQSIDGLDLLFGSDPPLAYSIPPPPPPPPPPFFQGLFSAKKGKSKKTYSNPPPPPPPPPARNFQSRSSMAKVESRTSKPNPPAKVNRFIGTGSESPLMPIPPPPPPPPFKMPAWKFVRRGDYVRMASDISISSDEPDDSDVAQSSNGRASGSLFCPSPDVDTKADNFIARFREGLKLEKINSVRGRSNLGPGPGLDESKS